MPTSKHSIELLVLTDVRKLILAARSSVARTVNQGLVLLNWEVGTAFDGKF